MSYKRKTGTSLLLFLVTLPLLGGTGRPSDGFLSFILLFGFLVFILGALQLVIFVKRKIRELMEDIF